MEKLLPRRSIRPEPKTTGTIWFSPKLPPAFIQTGKEDGAISVQKRDVGKTPEEVAALALDKKQRRNGQPKKSLPKEGRRQPSHYQLLDVKADAALERFDISGCHAFGGQPFWNVGATVVPADLMV